MFVYGIMAAKAAKKDQKTEASGDDSKEVSMAAVTNLQKEHWNSLSSDFKTTISTLETKLDQITIMAERVKYCFIRNLWWAHERPRNYMCYANKA